MKMNIKILTLTCAMAMAIGTFAASVTTDRTWYLAGETMTVSIADDDARIAYAEVCDTRGLAAGVVVELHDGAGSGIIQLPADLHSGYYVLSVYTRHDATVSHQLVAIVNPLQKSDDDDIVWERLTTPDSLSYPQAGEGWPDEGESLSAAGLSGAKGVDERETDGHIIRAHVRNVHAGHTYEGSQILPTLSIIGKQIHYFEGKMANDSTAVFYTYGLHGKLPLVLTAKSADGELLPIEMASPFAALLPKELPPLVFHYNRSEVEARSLAMQRHQKAIAPAKREQKWGEEADDAAEDGVPLDYDASLFGTQPLLSYNLDEYRQFLTIKEVLVEYVTNVGIRNADGRQYLAVQTADGQYNRGLPSLVLIDGMPVNDTERLLNYDARRIHHINIYGDQFTFGHGVYNGILSFVTRSGRLTNYPTERHAQYLVYEFP